MATGDIIYRDTALWKRLAANAAASNKFLRSVSSGIPSWAALVAADIPVQTTVATTTSTGNVSDYAPGASVNLVRCNNASELDIHGIVAGYDGQILNFVSIGAGRVYFVPQSGTDSTPANRLICTNTQPSGTVLAPGIGHASFQYDSTTARWRLIEHEQGVSLSNTFTSGAWKGSTSDPAIGNGTGLINFYVKGARCDYILNLNMGSSTTFGTGFWQFPVTFTPPAGLTPTCMILCYDSSTGKGYSIAGTYSAAANPGILGWDSTGTPIDATHPFTWAQDDIIRFSITYDIG
jgi:hypothetical protein